MMRRTNSKSATSTTTTTEKTYCCDTLLENTLIGCPQLTSRNINNNNSQKQKQLTTTTTTNNNNNTDEQNDITTSSTSPTTANGPLPLPPSTSIPSIKQSNPSPTHSTTTTTLTTPPAAPIHTTNTNTNTNTNMSTTTTTAPATPLLERILTNATKHPDKLALTFLNSGPNGGVIEKEMKYRDVVERTDALAANLLAKGLVRGNLAVLVYPPSLDFIIAFLACVRVGIIAVPVFPPHPSRKDTLLMFSKIVDACDATFALTSTAYSHMKKLASLKEAFTKFTTSTPTTPWPTTLSWITTDALPPPKPSHLASLPPTPPTPSSHTTAFLQFTSGSTSEPKGVQITHANLSDNLAKITSELRADGHTRVVSWLPQYHDMGLIGSYLGLLYCGGSGFYMSPLTFVQRPVLWVEMVGRFRGTHLQAPNFAFKLTARKFDSRLYSSGADSSSPKTERRPILDLSSVKHVINAAEPVTEESINSFIQKFQPFGLPPDVIFPTYGLAEHTVFVCSGGTQRLTVDKRALEVDGTVVCQAEGGEGGEGVADRGAGWSRLVGCGYPERQGVDVRIVEPDSRREVGEDMVGEIWVRSGSKAAGYYKRSEDSKREFCARIVTGGEDDDGEGGEEWKEDGVDFDVREGYLRSGDLGFLHRKELFVCGRIKDLIIVGGRNYYPQDVEATAESCGTKMVRPGCSAAFTVDPVVGGGGDGEVVALVLEMKEVPVAKDIESVCSTLVESLRGAVMKEHSLSLSHIVLLAPRTVKKTSSGKIARAWCRKAFVNKTFASVIYTQSFATPAKTLTPLEIENNDEAGEEVVLGSIHTNKNRTLLVRDNSNESPEDIRGLSKATILERLTRDVSRVLHSDPLVDDDLITYMDSLSISQFKGLLESKYATKISDEYLFQEGCNLRKLVEVVKLGYAPDDVDQNVSKGVRKRKGLAGALGCPPGVRCSVM